jgi:dTDP-4-dehydrorhamnose reductase
MILVVGANGMLGRDLMTVLNGELRGVDLGDIDITSPDSVRSTLVTLKPSVVVNVAAYTVARRTATSPLPLTVKG